MNAISSFRKCTLSNDELLEKVDQMTDGLFDIKHKSERDRILTRHIPVQPNNDYDLLVGELLLRFDELQKAAKSVLDGWNHPDNIGEMWIPDFCGEPIKRLENLLNYKSEQ